MGALGRIYGKTLGLTVPSIAHEVIRVQFFIEQLLIASEIVPTLISPSSDDGWGVFQHKSSTEDIGGKL